MNLDGPEDRRTVAEIIQGMLAAEGRMTPIDVIERILACELEKKVAAARKVT